MSELEIGMGLMFRFADIAPLGKKTVPAGGRMEPMLGKMGSVRVCMVEVES